MVGSSAINSMGSQASAIAIMTRWRMPPDSLCGYSSMRFSGEGMWTRRNSSIARSRAARRAPPRWRRMVSMICSPMVKLGLSEVIGSWKIIASRLPRRSRKVWSGTSSRSNPSKRIEPVTSAECFDSKPMMASEVTLLPQPDSPTSPSVAPLATLRSTLSTAWVMRPLSPWNSTRKSLMSISGISVISGPRRRLRLTRRCSCGR